MTHTKASIIRDKGLCIRNVKKADLEKCLMALPEISILVSIKQALICKLHCIAFLKTIGWVSDTSRLSVKPLL